MCARLRRPRSFSRKFAARASLGQYRFGGEALETVGRKRKGTQILGPDRLGPPLAASKQVINSPSCSVESPGEIYFLNPSPAQGAPQIGLKRLDKECDPVFINSLGGRALLQNLRVGNYLDPIKPQQLIGSSSPTVMRAVGSSRIYPTADRGSTRRKNPRESRLHKCTEPGLCPKRLLFSLANM